jgi:hypothetical protein
MELDIYISSINNILKKYKKKSTLNNKIHEETIKFYINSLKKNESKKEINNIVDLNDIPIPEYKEYKNKKKEININKKKINDSCNALEWSPKGEKNKCIREKENDSEFCNLHINYRPYGIYE